MPFETCRGGGREDRSAAPALVADIARPAAPAHDRLALSVTARWALFRPALWRIGQFEAQRAADRISLHQPQLEPLADAIADAATLAVERPRRLVIEETLAAQRRHRHQRSEEHTSELQSLMRNSYAVFCLKKKKQN